MDTTEFRDLLYKTEVRSDLPLQELAAQIEPLYSYIMRNMPESLFRYRKCDERSIDAFYRDHVWVSSARSMNDGFDARMFFDKNAIRKWKDQLISEETKSGLRSYFTPGSNLPVNAALFPGIEQIFNDVCASEEQRDRYIAFYSDFLNTDVESVIDSIAEITQQSMKFCCLSETINSSAMWGLYSNNETGFALAYDCRDLGSAVPAEKGLQRTCSCFPIIYGNTRYQVPTEYIVYLLTYRLTNATLIWSNYAAIVPGTTQMVLSALACPDNLVPTKIALHKSNEWKQEAEWRLFCSSADDQEFQKAEHARFTLKPRALYLGRRISPIFEKILTDIAKEKGIPVYKMSLDDDAITYNLIPKQVL